MGSLALTWEGSQSVLLYIWFILEWQSLHYIRLPFLFIFYIQPQTFTLFSFLLMEQVEFLCYLVNKWKFNLVLSCPTGISRLAASASVLGSKISFQYWDGFKVYQKWVEVRWIQELAPLFVYFFKNGVGKEINAIFSILTSFSVSYMVLGYYISLSQPAFCGD